jgi:hypothetical protein
MNGRISAIYGTGALPAEDGGLLLSGNKTPSRPFVKNNPSGKVGQAALAAVAFIA